jgi:hypothetical protein
VDRLFLAEVELADKIAAGGELPELRDDQAAGRPASTSPSTPSPSRIRDRFDLPGTITKRC